MIARPAANRAGREVGAAARAGLLLAGLGLALCLRILVAGSQCGASPYGGVAFALAVAGVCGAAGMARPAPASLRRLGTGIAAGCAGAGVLIAWPLVARLGGGPHAALVQAPGWPGFGGFAAATLVVVGAEEALLRGALWRALVEGGGRHGEWIALGVGAMAFALLHVPWYGWGVLPLDLAVGLWLGALRMATGGLAAPMVAHAGADLGTWWLL